MCDTLSVKTGNAVLFGKNSDRRPNEIQPIEFHPAADRAPGEMIHARYIDFPQAAHTNAVVICRPQWIWGAEIGVNEHGLCIGNEALWSNTPKSDRGLMGMDILRAALERADSVDEGIKVITGLLEQYGQGGNGAFDIEMHYDNAYLLADREGIAYLETCGRDWALRRRGRINISNCIVLGADADAYRSASGFDFKGKYIDEPLTRRSRSRERFAQTGRVLDSIGNIEEMINALRQHNDAVRNPFAENGQASVCMHFGDKARNNTTQSMAVEIGERGMTLWLAGASQPCVTLYKPFKFNSFVNVLDRDYWIAAERYRRRLVGRVVPAEFSEALAETQRRWIDRAQSVPEGDFEQFTRECLEEERAFYAGFEPEKFADAGSDRDFLSAWADADVAFQRVVERCADFTATSARS